MFLEQFTMTENHVLEGLKAEICTFGKALTLIIQKKKKTLFLL